MIKVGDKYLKTTRWFDGVYLEGEDDYEVVEVVFTERETNYPSTKVCVKLSDSCKFFACLSEPLNDVIGDSERGVKEIIYERYSKEGVQEKIDEIEKQPTSDTSTQNKSKDYKDTSNKLPMHSIEPVAYEVLAKVLAYGVEKYGEENCTSYQHGELETYRSAMLRHMVRMQRGEEFDTESGLPHLYHMMFNVYSMCYIYDRDKEE